MRAAFFLFKCRIIIIKFRERERKREYHLERCIITRDARKFLSYEHLSKSISLFAHLKFKENIFILYHTFGKLVIRLLMHGDDLIFFIFKQ